MTFGPPAVLIDGHPAHVLMSRPTRLALRVPEDARTRTHRSPQPLRNLQHRASSRSSRAFSGLHPVTSPAVSRSGMVYATISGPRGKQTPVSIVRISPDGRGTPFVTGILNATGLAFNPDGDLFVTSRAEGNVYRIDSSGEFTVYAEGMGVATGAAFDAQGNLFVGDRSGTIFKIDTERKIFVYATLEPSVAAYHLAVDTEGTLFVTAPALNSNDAIWAIDTHGQAKSLVSRPRTPPGPRSCQRRSSISPPACTAAADWFASPPRRSIPRCRRTQPHRGRLLTSRHHHPRHQRGRLRCGPGCRGDDAVLEAGRQLSALLVVSKLGSAACSLLIVCVYPKTDH